jgi:hypothetical protein
MTATIDWGYDAARLGAISFTLTETGGGGATGTVTLTGQYLHAHAAKVGTVQRLDVSTGEVVYDFDQSYVTLSTALKAALDLVGNSTYTVVFNSSSRSYAILASGGGVTAFTVTSPSVGAQRMLGELATVGALFVGSTVEVWHWSYATNLGFSRWDRRAGAPEGAEALIGSDGSVRGLSTLGTPELLDFVFPSEPREAVRSDESQAGYTARGWTHQRAIMRCRSIEPAVIEPGDGSLALVAYLRPDFTFAPRLKSADYLDYQDVPYSWYVVGEIA